MENMNISEKVKEYIKRNGIKMQDLAAKLGISKQSLSNTLSQEDMRVSTLERISEALGLTVAYFYKDPDEPLSDIKDMVQKEIKKALQDMEGFRT